MQRASGSRCGGQSPAWLVGAMAIWFATAVLISTRAQGAAVPNNGNAATHPTRIRLALGGFATSADAGPLWEQSRRLLDLTLVELSSQPGVELVDRAELDRVLREVSLSLAGSPEAQAVRVGQLLRADWLLTGSLLRLERQRVVIARLLDARTGVVRDLASFGGAEEQELSAWAGQLARFVQEAQTNRVPIQERRFLSLGGFENLGVQDRYPEFRKELRAALEQRLRATGVAMVERMWVNPLLRELRLDLGGLTESAAAHGTATAGTPPLTSTNPQPSFLLVDGVYQAVEDGESKVELVLRLQPVGGVPKIFTVRERPGAALQEKALGHIQGMLASSPGGKYAGVTPPAIAQQEAGVLLERGKDRARLPGALKYQTPLGGYIEGQDPVKRRQNILEAMEAFEGVLLLEPTNLEAKVYLARCLLEPGFEKKDAAREYLQEVLAVGKESPLGIIALDLFNDSWLKENDQEALRLYESRAAQAADPVQRWQLFRRGLEPMERLSRNGRADAFRYATNYFWREWEAVEWASRSRPGTPAIMAAHPGLGSTTTLINSFNGVARIFDARPDAIDVMNDLMPALAERHPSFAPYLWTAYLAWLGWERKGTPPQPAMVTALKQSLERCLQSPGSLPDLPFFIREFLPELRGWSNRYHQPDVLELADKIAALQPVSPMTQARPAGRPTMASQVITNSKLLVPLAPQGTPEPFTLGPAVFKVPTSFITFVVDGDHLWINDGVIGATYHKKSGKVTYLDWPDELFHDILCAHQGPDHVWFGTDGGGLVEVEKKTRQIRRYTEQDGLLMSHVTALHLAGGRLWIGFGHNKSGGAGYLDLGTRRIVGFSKTLRIEDSKQSMPAYADTDPNQPPRNRVMAIAADTTGDLWFASERKGVQRFRTSRGTWSGFSTFVQRSDISSLIVSPERVIYGSLGYNAALILQDRADALRLRCHAVSEFLKQTLGSLKKPNNMVYSLAFDDPECRRLWVGGLGYVALVDIAAGRIERLCELDEQDTPIRCLAVDGGDLWVAANQTLHRVSRQRSARIANSE